MRKYLKAILAVIVLAFLLTIPLRTTADSILKDNKCVLPITVKFEYGDNQSVVLRTGFGILVGSQEESGGVTDMIALLDLVQVTPDEITAKCDELGLDEDKRKSAKAVIYVTVDGGTDVTATIREIQSGKKLALLSLGTAVYDQGEVVFNVDDNPVKNGEQIYILETGAVNHPAYVDGAGEILEGNNILYVHFTSNAEDKDLAGYAVFNSDEEFLGMVLPYDAGTDTHHKAISAKEISGFIANFGVKYKEADHTIVPIDKKALISATDMADMLDLSPYTEESAQTLEEVINEARSIIINADATQEEVDDAYSKLMETQRNLTLEKKLDTITIVFIIIAGVLLVGLIVFIIVLVVSKKRRKKKELEAEELESKKAPVATGPFVPSGRKKSTIDSRKESKASISSNSTKMTAAKQPQSVVPNANINARPVQQSVAPQTVQEVQTVAPPVSLSEKLSQGDNPRALEGFAPSSKAITFNEEDTTVLSALENEPALTQVNRPYLIASSNESRIEIIRDSFVLGKSAQKADWIVDSKAVSREHLKITRKDDNCYATDLSSLNGSYINGEKLNPHEDYVLNDGDKIKLADVEYTFYKQQ